MLDDLRNSAANSPEPSPEQAPLKDLPSRRRSGGNFLGMSPGQRFILALMLFVMSCVMGAGCLILTGKVYLPFF